MSSSNRISILSLQRKILLEKISKINIEVERLTIKIKSFLQNSSSTKKKPEFTEKDRIFFSFLLIEPSVPSSVKSSLREDPKNYFRLKRNLLEIPEILSSFRKFAGENPSLIQLWKKSPVHPEN